MENKKARVVFYDNYRVGLSSKTTQGYGIELEENGEWILLTFVELKDGMYVHQSFLKLIGQLNVQGYEIIWQFQ